MKKYILPKGFVANGIHCGAKRKRKDLALFYSESICKIAAVFTKNVVKAAPVIVAQENLGKNSFAHAVVVNSGNANCMTGKQGIKDAKRMVIKISKLLKIPEETVLVSSTGIIGQQMNMKPVLSGMKPLVEGLSKNGLSDAADGILTTDRFQKVISRSFKLDGKKITITGVAKGAGMIHPDMATMLCYIFTDANITKKATKKMLKISTESAFNAITVDGDMSTNDTVMFLANGETGNKAIVEGTKNFKVFQKHLNALSKELAGMIVLDGEGAHKFISIKIKGAAKKSDAQKIAKTIAGSMLVKCACLGGDPNWGRIASAAGASGVNFDQEKLDIKLDGVTFLKSGKSKTGIDRKKSSVFKGKNIKIEVNLHQGKSEASAYTCDISKKYITLNAYYTT